MKLIVTLNGLYAIARVDEYGYYWRPAANGLELRTNDLEYFFLGAKTCKTLVTAKKWLNKG